MEQRCLQLFGNEWKKILQCHYTLCQVYLFPMEPLCSKVVFHFFHFLFFFLAWFWVKNMAVELSTGSSVRVLKLDSCTNESVSAFLLVFIDSVLAYGEMHCGSPLKTLIHSRWDPLRKNTGKAPVDGKWLTAGSQGRYRTLEIIPGSELGTTPYSPGNYHHGNTC